MEDKKQSAWDDEALAWEEVRTDHLVTDKWIDFRRVRYRFPDGTEFEPFYNYSRRDYVVILARDREGRYICVRQFRHGIRAVTTEFPAGGIERQGQRDYASPAEPLAGAEDALEAAKRELREETGYVSDKWRCLLVVPSHATLADNYAYLYAADDCVRAGDLDLDDTEFLGNVFLTGEEIEALIREGRFQQAIHILAYMMDKAGW